MIKEMAFHISFGMNETGSVPAGPCMGGSAGSVS